MAHEVKLGELVDEDQMRDAIHIAVAPVMAAMGERLQPGQPIGLVDSTDPTVVRSDSKNPIGIVDPFLKNPVDQGEWFWMFLMPGSISSLRHEWTHPSFAEKTPRDRGKKDRIRKEESEEWLRCFCENHNTPGYDTVMEAIEGKSLSEDYAGASIDHDGFHFSGIDAGGDIPPEFWDHVENVIGKKMTVRPDTFTCSC